VLGYRHAPPPQARRRSLDTFRKQKQNYAEQLKAIEKVGESTEEEWRPNGIISTFFNLLPQETLWAFFSNCSPLKC
jgi:hypothetical protein